MGVAQEHFAGVLPQQEKLASGEDRGRVTPGGQASAATPCKAEARAVAGVQKQAAVRAKLAAQAPRARAERAPGLEQEREHGAPDMGAIGRCRGPATPRWAPELAWPGREPAPRPPRELVAGQEVNGTVAAVGPAGIWFDVGAAKCGLLPRRLFSPNQPDFKVGDIVEGLLVERVDTASQRFMLSSVCAEFAGPWLVDMDTACPGGAAARV